MLGEANPFGDSGMSSFLSSLFFQLRIIGRSGPTIPNMDGGIKVEYLLSSQKRD